jgi:hypothetical protein
MSVRVGLQADWDAHRHDDPIARHEGLSEDLADGCIASNWHIAYVCGLRNGVTAPQNSMDLQTLDSLEPLTLESSIDQVSNLDDTARDK